ncbi:unnamed protein product [Effrenium voratum]|nr:unnamed protein product [Effrenium voratum]|mmetsp:Transcript_124969/g.296515  ORF Transcript_124969/g.296515 Transcript_124969/m.296515 type:complete len:423 (-) Transcript_124969:158-1426(-)|eukprot:CAMPEP_0181440962 /NCGR_PEP_ID=MMETSP1110-20121109/23253_1 /TAXON_ID=174948 /ORGANISM="Symbiodinium sp., Strain CCMP421" /LENGTH=422 /DNA_ID=CAMNT_0023564813 /DNA_START=101 /DNA_END=1369 /DNA_ORIENTATION=-
MNPEAGANQMQWPEHMVYWIPTQGTEGQGAGPTSFTPFPQLMWPMRWEPLNPTQGPVQTMPGGMPGMVPSSQAAGPRALGALAAQAPHAAPKAMAEVEVSCSALVTPRSTEVPPDPESDVPEAEAEACECGDAAAEARLSASAARRLRRKRAAERAKDQGQLTVEQLRAELKQNPDRALRQLRGQVWRLSRDAMGCRLVQDVLELGSRESVELGKELHGHVLEAAVCPHANYVVQKVVSHLSVGASSFVAEELRGSAVRSAKHRFACRIFCRLLEFCGSKTSRLVDELLLEVGSLCSHSFAHHVVQSILEHGEKRHKKIIAQALLEDAWGFATHKNSSYLIEKMLLFCEEEDQESLIAQLGKPETLLELSTTQYGSYVARALMQDARVDADAALRLMAAHKTDLAATKHGHRFLADVGLAEE